jgi:hypothetical protein
VVLLIAGGLFFALRGDDEPEPPPDETTTTEQESAIDLTEVSDDTDVITAEVPDDWDDLDGRPFDNGIPNLRAARNLDDFLGTYEGAGIDITAFSADDENALFDPSDATQIDGFLDQSTDFEGDRGETVSSACDAPERNDFDGDGLTGSFDLYTNCGSDNADVVLLAAANEDGDTGVVVFALFADDDEQAARDDILSSIDTSL